MTDATRSSTSDDVMETTARRMTGKGAMTRKDDGFPVVSMADVLLSQNPKLFSSSMRPEERNRLCPCCAFVGWDNETLCRLTEPWEGTTTSGSPQDNDRRKDTDKKKEKTPREEVPVPDPREALRQILEEPPDGWNVPWKMVDTHAHPHLARERLDEYVQMELSSTENLSEAATATSNVLCCLTCSVEPADWKDALEYAGSSEQILPALGVHPWYLEHLDEATYLDDLAQQLQQHGSALVGEAGLCKMARYVRSCPEGKTAALEQQRRVFTAQLKLAAQLQRPISVHCVQQHGILLQILQDVKQQAEQDAAAAAAAASTTMAVAEEEEAHLLAQGEEKPTKKKKKKKKEYINVLHAFPPAIAMHSFGGTAHQARELLAFEQSLYPPPPRRRDLRRQTQQQQQQDNDSDDEESRPPLFYFGFSHAINVLMCRSEKSLRQGREAIRAIPPHRLLSESDVVAPQDVVLGTAGAIGHLATALDQPIPRVAQWTAANGLRFFSAGKDGNANAGNGNGSVQQRNSVDVKAVSNEE